MTTFRFPNETEDYRRHRDELLDAEVRLRDEVEAVAELRRTMPLGGRLKEDYVFERVGGDGSIASLPFESLFGEHDSLILYSMMFGAHWDAPCPSCTSIVDSMNANCLGVQESAAIAVVAAADAETLRTWAQRRHWRIPVFSAGDSSYLLDYAGFETDDPGVVSAMNVFQRTPDGIFHFWSSELVSRPLPNGHPRHVDMVWPMWNLLDLTPQGRGDTLVPKQDFEHQYFSENVIEIDD